MDKEVMFSEHKGMVVKKGKYEHVMALTLNPNDHKQGIIRTIIKRTGLVSIKGFRDISKLVKVESVIEHERYNITNPIEIKGESELVKKLTDKDHEFVGFEDPDLVFDELTKRLHLYFTIPLLRKRKDVENIILLGHAEGRSLDDLRMTEPVININRGNLRAKEVSFAPVNSNGVRLNLIESNDHLTDGERLATFSVVRVAEATDYGPPWKLGQIVFHPKFDGKTWCAGHASPGPFLPLESVNIGKGRLVGLLNGREGNTYSGDRTFYGKFTVGLFVYDFENGKVLWISEKPVLVDRKATSITFASNFIQTSKNGGILYAHVDDSFVRAYSLNFQAIKAAIPLPL